jgi:two-component system response regulator AdeR
MTTEDVVAMPLFRSKNSEPDAPRLPLVAMIDDEEDLCRLVRLALEPRGYAVQSAHDGKTGLDLIRQCRPDIILLDIKMPRMNGYQVLAQLQQDRDLAWTPIIVMSSLDDEQQFTADEWARRMKVARFLPKPFEPDAVADAVAALLAKKS